MSETNRRPIKRKRNKFLQNAKSFGRKGIFGRGTHIEDDQYNYFINILDAMKAGFDSTEDKVNMANNVFEQTAEKEIHLASNQIVCKALELLIGFVDAEHLEHYFETFAATFRPICSNSFASHVLQKMVEIAFLRAVGKKSLKTEDTGAASSAKRAKVESILNEEEYNLETKFTKAHRENCCNFVLRISKFMLNNLEDFVWDPCASHIMRTCILSLAGVHVAKVAFEKGGADMAKNKKLYEVPEEWVEVMKQFPERLKMWPQFSDFPYQDYSAALMSVICIALKFVDPKMLKSFGKKLLKQALVEGDTPDNKNDEKKDVLDGEEDTVAAESEKNKLPKAFECQSAIVLVETLITLAHPKLLTQLYAMLFVGHIQILAKERSTNFAVQKLLMHIKETEDFESIFDELVGQLEELLKIGNTGVVSALSGACLRLGAKQAQFIVGLQTALHVAGDKEKSKQLFRCLVKLKPYDVMLKDNSAFVHLHGSIILQDLLQFNKPIFLVNCILETPAEQLVSIFNTPNGSHIADAFLQSKFIGAKSREKFIQNLENFYVDLAITKFGSRVVEQCFAVASDAQKQRIVKELANKFNMLTGSPFGRLLVHSFRIETYRLSSAQWKASLEQKEKNVKEMFKDIIN